MLKITLLVFGVCWIIEKLIPGWKLPDVRTWHFRVIAANLIQLVIVLIAGRSWEVWLSSSSVFHLSSVLSPVLAGFIAYFIATLVFYFWHRLRHENDFFWRHFHQIHHSPQRLEVITSFYKHPAEMIANSILGSVLVYTLLGLSLEAGAVYTLFTALGEFFYHTNVKTPRWVGYIFQRPEMHRIHHEKDRHKNNYGDFVIWDMLFGTYQNPKEWTGRCGFDETLELGLKDMLAFKDIHRIAPIGPIAIGGLIVALLLLGGGSVYADATRFSNWQQACVAAEAVVAEGDLIFIDSPNFLFREVAKNTGTWTSHVGIALRNEHNQWVVKERRVRPYSEERPLCDYLQSATAYQFEIKRFALGLKPEQQEELRTSILTLARGYYDFGFNFDASRSFCSKFVYEAYLSIDIEVGKIQTFREILGGNPHVPFSFWKLWFLGKIPWDRRTITPASQLNDSKFVTVLAGHQFRLPALLLCRGES